MFSFIVVLSIAYLLIQFLFIFKLISTIYTVHRAQSFSIKVAEDGFDNFKQTL